MKRHPSLQPLSREHHRALLCWRKLDQALERPSDFDFNAILDELRQYWASRFESHLQQEEVGLRPRLSQSLQERMLRDHNNLRSMFENLMITMSDDESSANHGILSYFAETLREHIRWEERTVFPYLQERLTDAELRSLLDVAAAADVTRDSDRCQTSREVGK